MNVPIKTPSEIEKMREAGRQAASVIEMITPHVKAGISTGEIDRLCHEYIVNELGSTPAPWHTTWLMEVQVALGKPW